MRQRRDYSKRASINDAIIQQSLLAGSKAVFTGEVAGSMSGIKGEIAMLILDAYKGGRRKDPDRNLSVYCDGITKSQLNNLISNFNDVKTMQNRRYDFLEIYRTTFYTGKGPASQRKSWYTILAAADPDGKRRNARISQIRKDKKEIRPKLEEICGDYTLTLEEELEKSGESLKEAYIVAAFVDPEGLFLHYPESGFTVTPVTIDLISDSMIAKTAGKLARDFEKKHKFHISPRFYYSKPKDITPHAIRIWPQ